MKGEKCNKMYTVKVRWSPAHFDYFLLTSKTANMSHFYNVIAQSVLQFSGDRIVMEVLTGLFVQVPTHQFIDVKKYLWK